MRSLHPCSCDRSGTPPALPADGNPAFHITLTMNDPNGNPLTEVVINGSNTALTNGTYTFALKDGDVVEITDIPDGSTYTVAEDEYVLYRETVKYSNTDAIKTIDATSVDTVEVENQRINRVLTGTTWIDADQDGIRDDDEDLLPGLTVTLYDENGDVVVCGVGAVIEDHELDFTGLGVPGSDHFEQGYCYIWNGALIQNSYITGLFRPDNKSYVPFGSWCRITGKPLGGAAQMAELLLSDYE